MKRWIAVMSVLMLTQFVFAANVCRVVTDGAVKGVWLNNSKVVNWRPWHGGEDLLVDAIALQTSKVCESVTINGVVTSEVPCEIKGYPQQGVYIADMKVVRWNPVSGMKGLTEAAIDLVEMKACSSFTAP